MKNIYKFEDLEFSKDSVLSYDVNSFEENCIIIDNGSHSCRAGWLTDNKPSLICRNLLAKLRGKKEIDDFSYFYGNDIEELEDNRWNIHTQYDMNVVTHFDIQEHSLDYLFYHLGINTDTSVRHPVCVTEAECIPNTFRQQMSEMLFECYSVPMVAYGIDALFSYNRNCPGIDFGLIVSCGYQTTHILPIINGSLDHTNCRRLNLGGLNMMITLRRLLQMKYPNHASMINLSRAQELLIHHTYIATDFKTELKKWQDDSFQEDHTINLQFPVVNTVTEKEMEMRKMQAIRLKEVNQRKREEKIKKEEEQILSFEKILEFESNPSAFKAKLKSYGLRKANDLYQVIDELKKKIALRKEKSLQYYEDLNTRTKETNVLPDKVSVEEVEKIVLSLEEKKLSIVDKKRVRTSRKHALNKRKSYASKERMRILSQLAKSAKPNDKSSKEDTFGMKDEDWDVYKFINKDASESEEEQEQERLNEIESSLSQYQLLINQLRIGRGQKYQYISHSTEQIRTPEILYQPSLVGNDQEGIVGMIEYVLKSYDKETQDKIIKNIFVTGGLAQIPGFKDRLAAEAMTILPFQSQFNITMAKNCLLDPWFGAKDFIKQCGNLTNIAFTKAEYEEYGCGYFKEHRCSNTYVEIER